MIDRQRLWMLVWASLTVGVALIASACCGGGGGSSNRDAGMDVGDDGGADAGSDVGDDTLTGEVESENGMWQFIQGPAGTSPGWYIVAESEGQTFESNEAELFLTGPDGERPAVVEQGLTLADGTVRLGHHDGDVTSGQHGHEVDFGRLAVVVSNPDGPARLIRKMKHGLNGQPEWAIPRRKQAGTDYDRDGVVFENDNCPLVPNEDQADEDDDGRGDACTADLDGDGLPDDEDNCPGAANPRQRDRDGDDIGDLCDSDIDGDGTDNDIDDLDGDYDGDGIPNQNEAPGDTDGDGVLDLVDIDDDGDSVPTWREIGRRRAQHDTVTDEDGNGVPDLVERDTDDDGVPNIGDIDANGDGIPETVQRDTDRDGVPDWIDPDADGNLVEDAFELDADGDGIPDMVEDDPTILDDDDGNGVIDYFEADSDDDGIPDSLDPDADNNDIPDSVEDGYLDRDTDGDGVNDWLDADADGDNIPDVIDDEYLDPDFDTDGIPDWVDPDADGDGVPDTLEDDYNDADADGDGIPDFVDSDTDGDGTPDVLENEYLDQDTDGDGIPDPYDPDANGNGMPDSLEDEATQTDEDSDGIPDAYDPDADGDGTPDSLEPYDPDELPDTDGDGIPDIEDDDSDNDGVPDRAEGNRDTDGDGVPDFRDPDDDGDGNPTSAEIADRDNLDVDGDGIPNWLDMDDETGCDERKIHGGYPDIGTFAGDKTLWTGITFAIQQFGVSENFSWVVHYAPEGVYSTLQYDTGIAFPPDLGEIGVSSSVGFLQSNERGKISADYLTAGKSVGFAVSIGAVSFGSTYFIGDDLVWKRGASLDTGWSFGVGLFGILPLNIIDISMSIASGGITHTFPDGSPFFFMLTGWDEFCPARNAQLPTGQQQPTDNAVVELRQSLDRLSGGVVTDRRSALRAAIAPPALGLFGPLSETTGFGPAQDIPAASNADWVADFMTRDDDALCTDCPNTSIDGIMTISTNAMGEAPEDNPAGTAGIAGATLGQILKVWPDRDASAYQQQMSTGTIDASFAIAFDNAALRRGDTNRYVSNRLVEITGVVGESVALPFSAAEIVRLVGFDLVDMEGATICVENNPRLDRVCGQIENGELVGQVMINGTDPLLLTATVDLTTAEGNFDGEVVDEWSIQLAPRQILGVGGPPSAVFLSTTTEIPSGAPANFSASLRDENGAISTVEATYTLIDPEGNEVDSVTTSTGTAMFQVLPTPVTPTVERFYEVEVTRDDERVPGYGIDGTGISAEALVLIDGQTLDELGWIRGSGARAFPLVPAAGVGQYLDPGEHTVEIINPGGRSSGPVSLTLEQ